MLSWYAHGMRAKLELQEQQLEELKWAARHSPVPHVRIKALAVYNVGQGRSREAVAEFLCVERRSVARWCHGYATQGLGAFSIKAGRGRRATVKEDEIEHYVRQGPKHFGIERTRWTLALLGSVVPSLRGMTQEGVRKVLVRLGYRYKRGQPTVHSPDPQYGEKRGLWCKR